MFFPTENVLGYHIFLRNCLGYRTFLGYVVWPRHILEKIGNVLRPISWFIYDRSLIFVIFEGSQGSQNIYFWIAIKILRIGVRIDLSG